MPRPWYYHHDHHCCCCYYSYSPFLSLCAYMLLALAHAMVSQQAHCLCCYSQNTPVSCHRCVRLCVCVHVCVCMCVWCVCVCVCVSVCVFACALACGSARVGVLNLLSSPSAHPCSHYQPHPYTDSLTTLTCTQPLPALLLIQWHATRLETGSIPR